MVNPLSGVSVIESIISQFTKLLTRLEAAIEQCETRIEKNAEKRVDVERKLNEKVQKIDEDTVTQENAIIKAQTISANIKSFIGE